MKIIYQGKDITGMVLTKTCIVRDTCGSRCDSLELEFENAAGWYSWGPEEDDEIIVGHNGYDSGSMYVNAVLPEDGKYRIFATALPCRARKKENRSFIGNTIEEIMRTCAMVSGMDFQIYGIDGNAVIPYIERENESCASFLSRLLSLESATLKCINGKYTAIGIRYAQDREAKQTLKLLASQTGITYRRNGMSARAVTIKTPFAKATAEDLLAGENHSRITISDYPARNDIQAGRWARGKLLCINRKCETVIAQNEFNPGFTAMVRINIEGDTDATGEWLIESVEHDLINLKTTAAMHRCSYTIQ